MSKKLRDLSVSERLDTLKKKIGLSEEELDTLRNGILGEDLADNMIENVVGAIKIPIGIAENFKINGRDYIVPMAIEESSVVAGANFAAKLCRDTGGFKAEAEESIMIGQIYLKNCVPDAMPKVLASKRIIRELANPRDSTLVACGGGLKDVEVRNVGKYVCIHLLIDVKDAMGANFVNTTAEKVAPYIEEITGGKVVLRVLSNLSVYRKAKSKAVWKAKTLEESVGGSFTGKEVAEGIMCLWDIASLDPFRRATHNKGIMNGIDALMIATGNDWRAIESGVHTYSSIINSPVTTYKINSNGDLEGRIEIPLAVGIVGGATKINPVAQVNLKLLGVSNAKELACVAASVGLANNFAALRVLSTEGIQRGHMKLHAKNIAHMAGATGDKIEKIARVMIQENKITVSRAKELMNGSGNFYKI